MMLAFIREHARNLKDQWPSVLVFAIGVALTFYSCFIYDSKQLRLQATTTAIRAQEYTYDLQKLADLYLLLNSQTAAFFSASNDVSQQEFDDYITASAPFEKLKGLSSVGYAPRIAAPDSQNTERVVHGDSSPLPVADSEQAKYRYPLLYLAQPLHP